MKELTTIVAILWVAVGCRSTPTAEFTHGVASGDPSQSSVVLWTRLTPSAPSEPMLSWQISEDSAFNSFETGSIMSRQENDHCVKVVVNGLKPGKIYFYRFKHKEQFSPIGRTKTLPEGSENIKIGVVNCAKYTGGYYHAYEELAKMDDVDVVIHLGDYIYESGPTTPESSYWPAFQATGRQHEPPHSCITLKDYRIRYAQYRSDSSLQKLHARHPIIATWDDHEIAMKQHMYNIEGKKIRNPDWEIRKDHSIKAYHEWIPLRPEPFQNIYRSFNLGNLVNLLMLDTRVCCKSVVTKTAASLQDTSRHIIGNEQLGWIKNKVIESAAPWNIFGNQLLISIKNNGWERWQGFPYDRNRFLSFVESRSEEEFVFITGNAHNPHHYIVFNEDKTDTLIHELLPGSISSGNNAEKARYDQAILDKEAKRLTEAENVLWFHQDSHGFIVLDVTKDQLTADWYFVSTIHQKEYQLTKPYKVVLRRKSNR